MGGVGVGRNERLNKASSISSHIDDYKHFPIILKRSGKELMNKTSEFQYVAWGMRSGFGA